MSLLVNQNTSFTGKDIAVNANGNISSTNVQTAIEELDAEKAVVGHVHTIANVTGLQGSLDSKLSNAAGSVQTSQLAFDSGSFCYRNRIINGDMRIDQRNNGAAVTPTGTGVTYLIDRFYQSVSVASKLTVQQAAAPAAFVGFPYAAKITVAASHSPTGSDLFTFNQAIEGMNTHDLAWGTANAKPITISFWARTTVGGTYSVAVLNKTASRSYVATYTLPANVSTKVTITIPGDTTGAWSIDNTVGMVVSFGLGSGTAYKTPEVDAWVSGNYQFAPSGVQFISTAGAIFYLSGIQLEAGSIATPFENRPYGLEFAQCQRYYTLLPNCFVRTGANPLPLHLPVQMRATPTITGGNAGFTASGYTNGATSGYATQTADATVNLVFNAEL